MKKNTSGFGKGFIYNLVLFAKHFENSMAGNIHDIKFLMKKTPSERAKIMSPNPDPKHNYGKGMEYAIFWWKKLRPIYKSTEEALSSQITLWANGASDHLYELVIPKKWENGEIGKLSTKLQERVLMMGHGFKETIYTYEDFVWLIETTKRIALLIDKEMGIKPKKGEWE